MERDRETDFDIIVAGAGHNGLVTAAYVAMAGLRVLVLEDRPIVGGNAVTEEHIPGYHFDTGSSSHSMIQSTPILKDDELGLLKHGLRYAFPEVLPIAILPDGYALEIHHSVEETARNIAQISRADADAYLNFEAEAREMAAVAGALGRTSIGDVDVSPEIRRKLSRRAWDVIAQRFSDPRIQSWLCQEASISLTPPDQAGTARFVYSAYVGRHSSNSSWGTAIGGSGALTDALQAAIERHGGVVKVGHRVTRILVDGDRAYGVECEDGSRFTADKAVVSSIHIKHLVDMVPPTSLPQEFRTAVDDYVPGVSIGTTYVASSEAPRFVGSNGVETEALAAFIPGTLADSLGWGNRALLKQPSLHSAMMAVHTATVLDPTRAVAGGHTIKCVTWQPYEVEGPGGWDALRDDLEQFHLATLRRSAPNITPGKIVGAVTRTPLDLQRANLHNVGGNAHGGEQLMSQLWENRPAPGWANYRMPIAGLYQTGATTHPGGGIGGVSGRNAALAVLDDLGLSLQGN